MRELIWLREHNERTLKGLCKGAEAQGRKENSAKDQKEVMK